MKYVSRRRENPKMIRMGIKWKLKWPKGHMATIYKKYTDSRKI